MSTPSTEHPLAAAAAALAEVGRQLAEALRVVDAALTRWAASLPLPLTRAGAVGRGGRRASRSGRMAGRWAPPPAPAYARTRYVRGRLVTGI